ncbi:hypothetical protein K439DRAFT_1360161, partial [Ramaria rubella]
LIQLRTGHAPLNKHLAAIGSVDSPLCPSCQQHEELMHHFLFQCPTYARQRHQLVSTLQQDATHISTLLSNRDAITPLFKHIKQTKRFHCTFILPDPVT